MLLQGKQGGGGISCSEACNLGQCADASKHWQLAVRAAGGGGGGGSVEAEKKALEAKGGFPDKSRRLCST